nr:MAG TPA: hypothetical protein [Bacteriophage sp.]
MTQIIRGKYSPMLSFGLGSMYYRNLFQIVLGIWIDVN